MVAHGCWTPPEQLLIGRSSLDALALVRRATGARYICGPGCFLASTAHDLCCRIRGPLAGSEQCRETACTQCRRTCPIVRNAADWTRATRNDGECQRHTHSFGGDGV